MFSTHAFVNHHQEAEHAVTNTTTWQHVPKQKLKVQMSTLQHPWEEGPCLRSLPAVVPAAMVAATGDWRLLTLDINLNRIPSRAMAKRMRGRGNMEPNRLGRRGFMVKSRALWERKHDTCTTVKEQQSLLKRGRVRGEWWDFSAAARREFREDQIPMIICIFDCVFHSWLVEKD